MVGRNRRGPFKSLWMFVKTRPVLEEQRQTSSQMFPFYKAHADRVTPVGCISTPKLPQPTPGTLISSSMSVPSVPRNQTFEPKSPTDRPSQ